MHINEATASDQDHRRGLCSCYRVNLSGTYEESMLISHAYDNCFCDDTILLEI